MSRADGFDAVVVGSGPNGLVAAVMMAEAGRRTLLVEAGDTVGGGLRTEELTLPGFRHDICATVLPLALGSPAFRALRLGDDEVRWAHPSVATAHPLDDHDAVLVHRKLDATVAGLGSDGRRWRATVGVTAAAGDPLVDSVLAPLDLPPKAPLLLARYGALGAWPATWLARAAFRGARARAAFAGMAAHSILDLSLPITAGYGLLLAALAHHVGWPVVTGGSQVLADALVARLRRHGGEVATGTVVRDLAELPPAESILLNLTPRQVVNIAGDRLPHRYRRSLERFRYGPGVFKLDWALDGPIPWRAPECARAGTVHVGGTLEEIAASEAAVVAGRIPERPYVLVAQQSACDPTRAPAGRHTGWAYCHVPSGAPEDMTERIEAQIERFAPGFRDRILARSAMGPAALERYDANYVGGDINGGRQDLRQLFTRPAIRPVPYATPDPRLYICSSSTPPGGGVHGMCGYHAAQAALRRS
jgi:phytoene dehydrogenase-like protein